MPQRSLFARPNPPTLVCRQSLYLSSSSFISSNLPSCQSRNSRMNGPPRPVEPDSTIANISLATSPGLTDFSDSQSASHLVRSSNPNDAFMRPAVQQQNPLVEWYTSLAGPWDPIHGRARNDLRVGGKPNYRPSGAPFLEYRSPFNSPSDCEATALSHLPSDSGYGSSLTRNSVVAEGSLYGECDRSGDTASVSSHLAGIHLDRPTLSTPEVWRQPSAPHNEDLVSTEANRLVCPHCKEKVKTKSELKYVNPPVAPCNFADPIQESTNKDTPSPTLAQPLFVLVRKALVLRTMSSGT